MNSWLATPMENGAPLSQGIHAVQFDATTYWQDWQQTGDDGAALLDILNTEMEIVTDTSLPSIPACADPQGLYGDTSLTAGTLLGDASSAAQDTPGSPQATADCQAVLSDYEAFQQELAQTAPGAKLPSLGG